MKPFIHGLITIATLVISPTSSLHTQRPCNYSFRYFASTFPLDVSLSEAHLASTVFSQAWLGIMQRQREEE